MKRELFNDGWIFTKGSGTSLEKLTGMDFSTAPEHLTLPHDAMIFSERKDSLKGASLGFYVGENYTYDKHFKLETEDSNKVIWLDFEGIYQDAFIYVNDGLAGRCNYGYGNYYIDISDYVKFGAENHIHILVRNEGIGGRWYTGGGIYRDVHIMMGEQLHIACEGTRIAATDIEETLAMLSIETPIVYVGSKPVVCQIQNDIFDNQGNFVASETSPITLLKHESKIVRQRVPVKNPKLWDLDNPCLYTCKTTVTIDEKLTDVDENRFGIRKLQIDPYNGLRLNGKSIKFQGGCLHHDFGVIGTATFAQGEFRRIQKMKEFGYNAVRTGAHPASRALLEACDELGLMLVNEFTDVFNEVKVPADYGSRFDLFWELDLTNMVNMSYNHPCVVIYDLGCENEQITDRIDKRIIKKMSDLIRSIDTTRYISISMNMVLMLVKHMDITNSIMQEANTKIDIDKDAEINSTMNQWYMQMPMILSKNVWGELGAEACSQLDVVGYNYMNYRYDKDHEQFPNRVMMGSECTIRDLADTWPYAQKHPYMLGDFCWTAWDYIGEAGVGRVNYDEPNSTALNFYAKWPYRLAECGTFDIIGNTRPSAYWRKIVWGQHTAPYIAVRNPAHFNETPTVCTNWAWLSDSSENWSWPGYENKPITVEVMSCAEEVELFVNGKSVGIKKTGDPILNCAIFDTVYEPGEIKAIDCNGEEYSIRSAVADTHIKVNVDNTELKAGESEIVFLEISICDFEGIVHGDSSKMVSVKVEGEGTLLGLGNADSRSTLPYHGNEFNAYQGRLLAIVRSGTKPGEITVSISAEGCESQNVILKVV